MDNRTDLIAKKNDVRSRINRLQRELTAEQAKGQSDNSRRMRNLQNELEYLRAEEYRLRLAIDRAR